MAMGGGVIQSLNGGFVRQTSCQSFVLNPSPPPLLRPKTPLGPSQMHTAQLCPW